MTIEQDRFLPLAQWPTAGNNVSEWQEIGKRCSAGRRTMWIRFERGPGEAIAAFELCAGREGGDGFVRVTDGNPQFAELLAVLEDAVFAATS
jgi:hypothetical protein